MRVRGKFLAANGPIVSHAAVFWMSRNVPSKVLFGGTLRDIQQTAAWEPNGPRRSDFFSLHGGSAAKIIFPEFAHVSLLAG